ncbi:HAD family hydrolase [Bosea rubneri]|uniref:HAD family phosphatase n=1 Tax=Bosea rubneri TaxID=3075434 RepID=A0ABU3S5B9_9HYPH|nr:HAD family phosphatase [Bosea sp. ZW T0_25]MDU0339965.1 HAD family phosphatase [Bosea sp. ZW T0_25]
MLRNMPAKALIFDMDGTIVDNMRFHDDAWEQWYGGRGLPFERATFSAQTAGMAISDIIGPHFPGADAAELDRLAEEKESLYRETYRPHVAPISGLVDLLVRARDHGVPMAVGTAAAPANISLILDTLVLRERFATIVSPSQGYPGKPHPDMFLVAAERMGVDPADCIVFEDAPNGVEAARRAGMRAVALLTMLDAEAFAGFDNVIASVPDFSALDGLPALRFA